MPLVAKWIFDGEFNRIMKKIGKDSDYIGQDWAQGGAKVKIILDDDGNNYKEYTRILGDGILTNYNNKLLLSGQTTSTVYYKDVNINSGIIKVKIKYTQKGSSSGVQIYKFDTNTSSWILFFSVSDHSGSIEKYFDVSGCSKIRVQIRDNYTFEDVVIDNIVIQEISNGHHLLFSEAFDFKSQLTGQSPIFKGGNSLENDGVNDYAYIPYTIANVFNPELNDFSIVGVFRTSTNSPIVSKRLNWLNTEVGFIIYVNASGHLVAELSDGTNEVSSPDAGKYVMDNKWHFFACIFNRSGNLNVFVDDDSLQFVDISSLKTSNISNDVDLVIGNTGGLTSFFGGHIIKLAYFDHALTGQEIQEEYGLATGWQVSEFVSGVKFKNNDWKQYIYFPANAATEVFKEIELSRIGTFTLEYLVTNATNVNAIAFEIIEKNSRTKVLNETTITVGLVKKVQFTTSEKRILLKIAAQQESFESDIEIDYFKIY